jgi:cytidyltransferase-like protein
VVQLPEPLGNTEKRTLSLVYCQSLKGVEPSPDSLALELGVDVDVVGRICEDLVRRGFLQKKDGGLFLTDTGRSQLQVVLVGGVFDIIHPGHIYFLREAKALGDVLLVSVARDKTVVKMRGRRALNNEKLRLDLVQSIRIVDLALLGSERDILETVERTRPDIIALGYDQAHDEHEIEAECAKRGIKVKVVRATNFLPGVKTSQVLATAPEEFNEI